MLGNKAENLQQLKLAGFNVKSMVVISTKEVDEILEQSKVSPRTLKNIKSRLNFHRGVAVRSSGTEEDGDLSWAGQFKTKTNVGFEDLEDAILDCARACVSDQVKAYSSVHQAVLPKLALIVQEMVDADISGVVFTVNPVCNSNEMVLEMVSGEGEKLVSGICQPNRYYVDFETLEIKSRDLSDARLNITDKDIGHICEISKKIHDFYGCPQDIEWAIEKETKILFINQSRRVTVISTVTKADIDATREEIIHETRELLATEQVRLLKLGVNLSYDVLSDQNIAEILTSHPCHMAFGLFVYLFAHGDGAIRAGRNEMGYDVGPELEQKFFSLVGGQPRCSIVHDALTYRIKGISLDDYCKLIVYYLEKIENDQQLANYPEVVLYQQRPSEDFLYSIFGFEKGREYFKAYQEFFDRFRQIEETLHYVCNDEFLPAWRESMSDYRREYQESVDISAVVLRYQNIANMLRADACKMFVKVARAGFFAYARLRGLLKKLFGEEGEKYAEILTSGIPLEINPNLQFSYDLFRVKNGELSLEDVIEKFGHLGIHELEISYPRYRNQLDALMSFSNQIIQDPQEETSQSLARSEELRGRLLDRAGKNRELLELEIEIARRYLSLREMVKFEYLKGYALLREISIDLNSQLGWEDDLIFHLLPEEVFNVLGDPRFYESIAKQRRERREKERMIYIPPVVTSTSLNLIGDDSSVNGTTLKGVGVTNYIVEGIAVVVRNTRDMESVKQLKSGSILVTATTDPAWSPILSIVGSTGGLVTEVGGLLAHGAIYAREVGMAAVLNVSKATNILRTGMRVRVNGYQGYVEILN